MSQNSTFANAEGLGGKALSPVALHRSWSLRPLRRFAAEPHRRALTCVKAWKPVKNTEALMPPALDLNQVSKVWVPPALPHCFSLWLHNIHKINAASGDFGIACSASPGTSPKAYTICHVLGRFGQVTL